MRRTPVLLAALAFAAVGLTGCSTSPATAANCPRPAVTDPDVMKLITVEGDTEDKPRVTVYTPFHTDELAFEDVVRGEGNAITTTDQAAMIDISLISGETGEEIVSTAYDGDRSQVFALSQWETTFPTIGKILDCATEGSRVAVALGPDDLTPEAAANFQIEEGDSAVAVFDVRKVYLSRAAGSRVFNSGTGLPSVVRAPDGRPGVIIPDSPAPEDLVVQTLIKGDGEKVTGDAPVRVNYTGLTWDERKVFDSSWGKEPASFTLDQVVPGFAKALEGQTVGSQVMVVVPPDQGYGDQEQSNIPANSTLVFVIDILGIDEVPPAS